jgi:hypothetical protein
MRDIGHYLQDYWAYCSSRRGCGRALVLALVWLAGMFAPLGIRTLMELPNWLAISWMLGWAVLGYVLAPYGMWKHHRAQTASPSRLDRK